MLNTHRIQASLICKADYQTRNSNRHTLETVTLGSNPTFATIANHGKSLEPIMVALGIKFRWPKHRRSYNHPEQKWRFVCSADLKWNAGSRDFRNGGIKSLANFESEPKLAAKGPVKVATICSFPTIIEARVSIT